MTDTKNTAKAMADALWHSYMKETEPTKRRHYGMRYAVWADIRDRLENDDEELSDS